MVSVLIVRGTTAPTAIGSIFMGIWRLVVGKVFGSFLLEAELRFLTLQLLMLPTSSILALALVSLLSIPLRLEARLISRSVDGLLLSLPRFSVQDTGLFSRSMGSFLPGEG